MFEWVLEAAVLGFTYGLGPCTVSCAPLIVPIIVATAKDKREGVIFSLIFSIGRVFSYTLLGFLSGLLGKQIDWFIPNWLLGVIFVLLGIGIAFNVQKKCLIKNVKITGPYMSFFSGVAMGLGPCPPLIALLALAVLSQSALTGLAMGFVFGLGTILSPILILGFFSGWFAKNKEFHKVLPYVSGGFLVLLGLAYIFLM